MRVAHSFVSAIPDNPAHASAGKVVSSNWNADHVIEFEGSDVVTALGYAPVTDARTVSAGSGLSGGGDLSANRTISLDLNSANTWTAKQSYTTGHTALELVPLDSDVGTIQVVFYNTDFSGVNDPVIFWGHNAAGAPSGGTRFFWGLEGNYNDTVNSHVWSETYIHRYESDGTTNYRPFSVACYDGHAEVSFLSDRVLFNHQSGTSSKDFGYIAPGNSPYMYIGSTATVLHGGNNAAFLQQAKSGGGYVDVAYVNSSNQVCIGTGANGNFEALCYDMRFKRRAMVAADYNPPSGGSTGIGMTLGYPPDNLGVFFGSGAPTLSAAKGSLYIRTDGSSTNDRCYVNTNGSTTWTAVVTVA